MAQVQSIDIGSKGVSATIDNDGKTMHIVLDLTGDFGVSSTGKTITVATGQVKLQSGCRVQVNAYRKP